MLLIYLNLKKSKKPSILSFIEIIIMLKIDNFVIIIRQNNRILGFIIIYKIIITLWLMSMTHNYISYYEMTILS